jgi:hypothetical protein
VADTLEAEWNHKLHLLAEAKLEYDRQCSLDRQVLDEERRSRIMALAADFPRLWSDPRIPVREKKRMVALMIEDVTLTRGTEITMHVRFKGGLPTRTVSFEYPKSFQTRRVNNSGDISWHKERVFVSEVFRNEEIGLEQMDEDVHRVFFGTIELGEFDTSEMRFRPASRI